MKRFILICVCLLLAGCGNRTALEPIVPAQKNYESIIRESRDPDDTVQIITSPKQDMYGLLELYELDEDLMEQYAISISAKNTQSYAIAIIRPTPDSQEEVYDKLAALVDLQKTAQRDYLPEQYEIACDAKLEIQPGGEVVLVMCEDSDEVYDAICEELGEEVEK